MSDADITQEVTRRYRFAGSVNFAALTRRKIDVTNSVGVEKLARKGAMSMTYKRIIIVIAVSFTALGSGYSAAVAQTATSSFTDDQVQAGRGA